MDLQTHYNTLWEKSRAGFEAGSFKLDPWIDNPADDRLGITLLARPSCEVRERIRAFLDELQQVAPEQYFYPDTDLHITILSIISCTASFTLSAVKPADYVQLLESITHHASPFEIDINGITASPEAVMVQGFPLDNSLQMLRESIRAAFSSTSLLQSLDQRYTLKTAHATVLRFRAPVQQPEKLLRLLENYRTYDFGTFEVEELEVVYNDWYQRAEKVKVLGRFKLG
ncbi:2'-5' RNA ligase family protein [Pontibacter chinhatensis]|uniref:2'-5' RNA ligase n=1 Tax=Pontibacter chinhatensis TaxID=1436961 RepID=A0A1I2RCX8_9BACT|nr:2'-5' RNA ligase family protein [Pontibacter chinhatensis]SFG38585.1 2'-5' RNA ligase [Pontibacter chinhatensis]